MTTDQRIGYSLGGVGVALILGTLIGEATLHTRGMAELPAHLRYSALAAGTLLTWWGFGWAKPERARANGQFLRDTFEQWRRGGRRAYDPVVPPAKPDHAEDVEV